MTIPEITIKVQIKTPEGEHLHKIGTSTQAAEIFRQIFDADQIQWREEVVLLCLNKANEIVGYFKVGQGGTDVCVIDAKIVFTIALNCLASAIVIAHNHPSGRLYPSVQDKELTNRIKMAGNHLGILLLDHIIITDTSYYSFADNGGI